ncbi:hypothetical protein PINS_up006105 [Pythium insidiosum]|nr:hypothetical protein PINS_up006105 [Pythium insidiosum]
MPFIIRLQALTAAVLSVFSCRSLPGADAHGYVLNPTTRFGGQTPDGPSGEHDAFKVLPPPPGVSYSGKGPENAVAFRAALQASKYGSLKDFILAIERPEAIPKCAGGAPQTLPDKITFGYPPYNVGFIHEGPCEMWCDDRRVMADDNCAKTYGYFGKGLAQMTYDKDKCVGAKEFTYYWLNVDTARWQTYVNCATIGGGGSGGGNSFPSSPPGVVPSPATVGPARTKRPGRFRPRPSGW